MSDSLRPHGLQHTRTLSKTNSWSLPKLMSTESVMPFNHLILCCLLLLLPSIFSSIRVFSNESVLHIRLSKAQVKFINLSTVSNDLLVGLAITGPKALHRFHNIHALFHLAKHHMLAIQPFSLGIADEKLGTICVGASVCHGQDVRTCMLQDGILIIRFLAIDGLATSVILVCEITTLAHKSWNYSVKAGNSITKYFLPSAQSRKIFCCLWNFVCKQLEGDEAQGLTIDSDVEEQGGVDCGVDHDHGSMGDSGVVESSRLQADALPLNHQGSPSLDI